MDELNALKTQLSAARSSLYHAEQATDRWPIGHQLYISAKMRVASWQREISRLEAKIEAVSDDN